jgi:hypothetical protein
MQKRTDAVPSMTAMTAMSQVHVSHEGESLL